VAGEPAERALAYWLGQVRPLPSGSEEAARVLTHARQALRLAARQGAAPEPLAELALALHRPLMSRGLVLTWAQDLQALWEARPDLRAAAPALGENLLSAWTAAGQWQQAHAILHALQRTRPQHRPQTARLLYRQGSLLWMQGHWRPALHLARQAWRLAPRPQPKLRVAAATLLMLAAWRLGRGKQARRWGRRALALCPPDDLLWRGRLHHYLLLVHLPRDASAAARHLSRALEYLRAAQAHLQLAHLWADATNLYLAQGRPDRAAEALAQSYALWRQIEDPAGRADYYRHAAIVTHALGRVRLARDYAAHAAERWAALGVRAEVRRCQRLLEQWRG